MTYSEVADLLTGQVPLPGSIDASKFVNDASNEVDSYIGFLYETPIDVSDTSPVLRPVRLLLKRLANQLATGRLILAAAAPSEQNRMHSYGRGLVTEALKILKDIADGEIILIGAPPAVGVEPASTAPMIANEDAESNVSAFYDRVLATKTPTQAVAPYTLVNNGWIPW